MSANVSNLEVLKELLAKFVVMDEETYQSRRKEFASSIGVKLSYLDSQYKRIRKERFKDAAPKEPRARLVDPPFDCLGSNRGEFYFRVHRTSEIVSGSLSRLLLLRLAPADFWSTVAPGENGISWDNAMSAVIHEGSVPQGMFDPSRLCGRGAWLDGGHIVLNCGDRLLVDGAETPIRNFESQRVYAVGPALRLPLPLPAPLSVTGCAPILAATRALHWRNPKLDPQLLVGWVVVSQMGGALKWRPDVWITGSKGNGKTSLIDRLVTPLQPFRFGRFGAGTTEAGIRQALGLDSLPWIMDESDPHSAGAELRIKKVLTMLRQLIFR